MSGRPMYATNFRLDVPYHYYWEKGLSFRILVLGMVIDLKAYHETSTAQPTGTSDQMSATKLWLNDGVCISFIHIGLSADNPPPPTHIAYTRSHKDPSSTERDRQSFE